MMMMLDVKSRLLYCAIMKIIVVMFALSMSLSNNINAATGDERKNDVIITIISQPDGCHDIGSRIVHKYESVTVHYTGILFAHLAICHTSD